MAHFMHDNKVFTVDIYDKEFDEFIDERNTQILKFNKRKGIKKVTVRHTNVCKPFDKVVWNIFKPKDLDLTLSLFYDKKAIGVAGFEFLENPFLEKKAIVLDAFCIHEKFRGKGIADVFLQIAVTLAKDSAQTNNVLLYSSNMGKKFYERNGFEKLKEKQFSDFAYFLYPDISVAKTGKGQGYDDKFYGAMKLNNKKFEKAIIKGNKMVHL
jgi:GNAT superfamily N-acetyltransferase